MNEGIDRFKERLAWQLGFIECSCAAFDAGHEEEAVRIAASLRVLLHDTSKMTSLLSHLNARNIQLLTTAGTKPLSNDQDIILVEKLLYICGAGLRPKLGNGVSKGFLPVDEWWNQTVLVNNNIHYSRKIVALTAADKDGGHHVDEKLTPEYEALMRGHWQMSTGDGEHNIIPIENHQFLMIRQMGYEILNSDELRSLCS